MEETFARKIRAYLDNQAIKLQKTETGCSIYWPAYCAQVDFIKDFICAVVGYRDWDEADRAGKINAIHDLACDIVDKIISWGKG